ncbi:tRNA (adenosine(37)-N6)-threonylcarbamoyltransferase complex dimerization subunit type 1 TsaB [Salinicoccus siamensis]|uniref:tRNA (Adenosine(37)-N6)-threonylcarbamoyltransferase complex dimerization subunit type 1 TsaB n=2 Tax=Salinicoccus siamensis TaxID=381830 RepID=A0ABV5Z4E1_9STAP
MITLMIDTSNRPLSVAINEDGRMVAEINTTVRKTHSATIMVHINHLLESSGYRRNDIDRIVVARGPGSYTGVRIGVTIAKTLAQALGVELYSVSSLAVIAASSGAKGNVLPMFDGRRGNVYSGLYHVSEHFEEVEAAGYKSLKTVYEEMEKHEEVCLLADGSEAFTENLPKYIHAVPRITTVEQYPEILRRENIHEMVPEYLKISEAEKNWINQQQS